MLALQWRSRAWYMFEYQLQRVLWHELETFDGVGPRFEEPQQVERPRGTLNACPGNRACGNRRD